MTYSYYMTMRPAMPGAMPKDGLREIVDDTKWGAYCRLDYDRELTKKEIIDYELRPAQEPESVHYRGFTFDWIWYMYSWRITDDRRPQSTVAYEEDIEVAKKRLDKYLDT